MELSLISKINENWLFRAKRIDSFTAEDVTELVFLYLIGLHILRLEYDSALFAVNYAKRTSSHGNFRSIDRTNTDLYQFLNIITDQEGDMANMLKNQPSNQLFWKSVKANPNLIRQFLVHVSATNYDEEAQKRILFQLESQLRISVPNYRSVRRIAVDWNDVQVSNEMRKLAVTRLLQALRAKARRGDILPWLEKLAKHRRYELFNVCDPETGKGCEDPNTVVVEPEKKPMSFIKTLALGALAGGVIGHAIGKEKD